MFTRWRSGLWGIISFASMAVVIVGFLLLLDLPTFVIWGGSLFAGGLLLLQVLSVIRGTAKRSQRFSTFEHNTLGEPVTEEFLPPFHRAMDVSSDESVVGWHAPVLQVMSGLGDLLKGGTWGFLGKGKTTNAENGLVLTRKRLLFVMVGPESVRRYCSSPKVTGFLDSLPGDASAKRQLLWQVGAKEVHDALAGLLTSMSLEELIETHYSFTLPLNEIRSMSYSLQRRTLMLQLPGLRLQYCLKTPEELTSLVGELTDLGVKVE